MRFSRALGFSLLGCCLPALAEAAAPPVVFRAVPSTGARHTLGGSPLAGTVYLQSLTDPELRRTAPLEQPAPLPPGDWLWQAEGEGFVTVGWNAVTAPAPRERPRTVEAPAVPSCTLQLPPGSLPGSPNRLEILAVEAGTIYDIDLARRKVFGVPAGHFFLVAHGPLGLIGVDAEPRSCRAGETVTARIPSPPSAQEHDVVAHFRLPPVQLDLTKLVVSVQPVAGRLGEDLHLPAVALWMGPRGVALFPRLPPGGSKVLRVGHPRLRSDDRAFPADGGGATALAPMSLRLRPSLTIPIDYRPARKHTLQKVVALFCGPRDLSGERVIERENCQATGQEHPLQTGLHEYVFPDLDTGQYVVNAQIDDETVYALADWFTPFLGAENPAFPEPRVHLLRELHVYGQIRRDGEPVTGEVRVQALDDSAPERRLPTDDELLYHLFYFGYFPEADGWISRLPKGAQGRPRDEVRGLFYNVCFLACDSRGACRTYPLGSTVAGDGRLDFEIGADSGVEVTITDAETDRALPEAFVLPRLPGDRAFHAFDGAVEWEPKDNFGGTSIVADAEGVAMVRLPAGRQSLGIGRANYSPVRREVVVPEGDWAKVEVALQPERETGTDPRFALATGLPAAGAFLQVFDRSGRRKPGCATRARADGSARFREGCLEDSTVALLHAEAGICFFRGEDLVGGAKVTAPPADHRAVRLRFLDGEGRPKPGVLVQLVFGKIVLDPLDFLIAAPPGRPMFIGASDAKGELELSNVPLAAGDAPEVQVYGSPRSRPFSVAHLEPGDTFDVSLP